MALDISTKPDMKNALIGAALAFFVIAVLAFAFVGGLEKFAENVASGLMK